ncbi:hypothetical protein ZWY2020_006688 [Hordeum vulgare]|nr:hypothetical protein ZWY2020_006688 [Hordeum vulgare]
MEGDVPVCGATGARRLRPRRGKRRRGARSAGDPDGAGHPRRRGAVHVAAFRGDPRRARIRLPLRFHSQRGGGGLLVLHGCGAVPSRPVASIGGLRRNRDDHDEWLALSRLEAAREHGQDALRGVEGAFTLLASVRFMLRSRTPDAAGRRQAMEEQLHAAAVELQAVVGSVANMSALAFLATQPAIRNRIQ